MEQARDYIPFPKGTAATYVPAEFIGKTNQQLFDQYGLALGGALAPPDASHSDPNINALIGSAVVYQPTVTLNGSKYVNAKKTPFKLSYTMNDPGNPAADVNGNVVVNESNATKLKAGWNVLTRTIQGQKRSFMVFNDMTPPTYKFSDNTPTTINKADLDRGALLMFNGTVTDGSTGTVVRTEQMLLSNREYVSALKRHSDGSMYVTVTFNVADPAGNITKVTRDFKVVDNTASLLKDQGRKATVTVPTSNTLKSLLSKQKTGIGF